MPLQPARVHDFRMLPVRDQAGEALRFVLGTNTFWHKGKRYVYGRRERPSWHAYLYTRAEVEVDCFWLAGTMRIKVVCRDEVLFMSRFMIYRWCESTEAEEEEESDNDPEEIPSSPPCELSEEEEEYDTDEAASSLDE
jgi:hypothetical protein